MSKICWDVENVSWKIYGSSKGSTCRWGPQIVTTDVNVVDVNVTTSKTIKKQVFKDREPRKVKSIAD